MLKRIAYFTLLLCCSTLTLFGQVYDIYQIEMPKDIENIKVQPLYTDSTTSAFIIWVKKGVKMHKHVHHTEQLMVLEGSAEMILGSDTLQIYKDDFIIIPESVPHAVTKVYGDRPLKVLSIQSPEFKGLDRVFLD